MKNRKYVLLFPLLLICFILVIQSPVLAFELDVRSAILVEAETGQVLYENNADEELPMASITKIMPMLLTMENIEEGNLSLDDEVIVSNYASSMGGSQIYLAENTSINIGDLLKAVTVASANDATVALSEAVGGTYSSFINQMNRRAEELGMENTNFVNSTGLPAENHYTTARDITKMSREIVKYDLILEWSQIWTEYLQLPNREAMLVNTNQLINSYPELDGIKTGYTSEAGYSLTATAKRDGIRLISVVLDTESKEERRQLTSQLLNYGFNNFSREVAISEGEEIQNIEIPEAAEEYTFGQAEEELTYMQERGREDDIQVEFVPQVDLQAPLEEGDVLGNYVVRAEEEEINSVRILAGEDVSRANIFTRLWRSFVNWIGSLIS